MNNTNTNDHSKWRRSLRPPKPTAIKPTATKCVVSKPQKHTTSGMVSPIPKKASFDLKKLLKSFQK